MNQKRNALMQKVCEAGFAVDDIVLYLDTHPSCQQGLSYYQDAAKTYAAAVRDYEQQYGPLQKCDGACADYFDWINNPWPWEGGCS